MRRSKKAAHTRLDLRTVKTAIASFPAGRGWERLYCKKLVPDRKSRKNWKGQKGLEEEIGGNYAFLMPAKFFRKERSIPLSGPRVGGRSRMIRFRFKPKTVTIDGKSWAVLYVGKSSKLRQRFQWHFSEAKRNTGGQVQQNLKKCRLPGDPKPAVQWLVQEGLICFRKLHGDDKAANREMIEIGLWAKYNAPFNIKSER